MEGKKREGEGDGGEKEKKTRKIMRTREIRYGKEWERNIGRGGREWVEEEERLRRGCSWIWE